MSLNSFFLVSVFTWDFPHCLEDVRSRRAEVRIEKKQRRSQKVKRKKIPESMDEVQVEVRQVGVIVKKWQILANGVKVYTSRRAKTMEEAIKEAINNIGVPAFVRRKLERLIAS